MSFLSYVIYDFLAERSDTSIVLNRNHQFLHFITFSNLIISFLQALSKTLTVDELFYLREQFALLEPKNGSITLENIKMVSLPYPLPKKGVIISFLVERSDTLVLIICFLANRP